jgi:plasmid replication initiation protein
VPEAVILALFHTKKRRITQNRLGTGHLGAIIVLARLPGFLTFREVTMPDTTWQALYRAALVEPDPIRLSGRIEAARRSIRQRLEQIEDSGDTRERQQLDDALYAMLTLAARKRSA